MQLPCNFVFSFMNKGKKAREEERRQPRVTGTQQRTGSKTQPHKD
jgi:hypothetical protein